MITVVDMTEVMTMIEGMTADMIVVIMIRGMNAITVVIMIMIVIVTIETTEGAGHRLARNGGDRLSLGRSMITWFAD
ncbi:hypothetical protein WLY71_04790 [Pseudomonas sp. P2663]